MGSRFLTGLALGCLLMIAPASAQSVTWQKFQPEKGGFTVDMPGTPRLKTEQVNGIDAYSAAVAFNEPETGNVLVFMAKYRADPNKPGPQSAIVLEAMAKGITEGSKILFNKEETIADVPVRRFAFEDADKDTIEMRDVFTGDNLIQLMYIGPPGNALGKRFLDSLTLTKP